ncbi:MAG: M42 family peptidase [Clostridiales bacterium]|nr:M42 family peptidase [Clostridiales bacterium]
MRELIKSLCACSGVSSREEDVRQFIQAQAKPYADSLRVDAMGNLIVFKHGRKSTEKRILLDAPMDEVGVMVSGFTDDGSIRFQTVGPVDRRTLIGKRVYLGENRIPGVVGMKPIHLTTKSERNNLPKLKELYIDIGAKDKAAAKALLALGDVGVFASEFASFGAEKYCKGKTLDSRISCAVLLKLLREELPVDCTFVFAAQEQVGTRGAFGAAFSERPDIVLCLDSVATGDGPERTEDKVSVTPGGGVVLPVSDRFTMYDRTLFLRLRGLAERENIPWQLKAADPGQSDARSYQRSRCGAQVAGLGLPVRYLHCPTEVASLEDAEGMLRLTRAFLQSLEEEPL